MVSTYDVKLEKYHFIRSEQGYGRSGRSQNKMGDLSVVITGSEEKSGAAGRAIGAGQWNYWDHSSRRR